MGVPIDSARGLSLWEYEAILSENNARNDPKGPPIRKPSRAVVRDRLARLAADPRFTH